MANAAPKTKNWVFTLNNPVIDELPKTWRGIAYCVWQKERGVSGTPHLQGYVQFTNARAMASLKKLCPEAHWEARMGTAAQAKAYCTKEETRVSGPWTIGEENEPVGQGKRTDLDAVKEMIDSGRPLTECWEQHFGVMVKHSRAMKEYTILRGMNKRNWLTTTRVIWGPTGTGKTRKVQELAGPKAYWMKKPGAGQSVFFDGYDGEEDVVIDEFYGWIPYDLLLRMCDRYPLLVDTKGGAVQFAPKRIWITSNVAPRQWYPKAWTPAMDRRLTEPMGSVEFMGDDDRLEVVAEIAAGSKRPYHGEVVVCEEHQPGNQQDDVEVMTLSELSVEMEN